MISARDTGVGRDIDVSLFDVSLHNLCYLATWYLNAGVMTRREPRSSHPSLTPSQLYKTQDGWLFVMCNKEKFWGLFAQALGKPEWANNETYGNFKARLANRDQLTADIDAVLQTASTEEWVKRLAGTVPVAPVYDVAQALDSDFVAEQKRLLSFDHPTGPVRMVASPVRAGEHPTRPAPGLGEHTNDILRELGLDASALEALRQSGVIGS